MLSFFLEGHFSVENSSLNLWEASIGSSYMCNKEQTFNITDTLSIHTFSLHVQPFGVNKGVFSTGRLFLKSPGVQTVALMMIRIRQEFFLMDLSVLVNGLLFREGIKKEKLLVGVENCSVIILSQTRLTTVHSCGSVTC